MNILAVGAHFDDVELGCGASLKKLHDEGHRIYIYVGTTSGFASASTYESLRDSDTAHLEGEKTAAAIGAELLCGDFATYNLDYGRKLDTQITQIIEKYNIEWVFTNWDNDPHHDHWNLSMAVYHGAKHVKRVLAYQSSFYEAGNGFLPNFYIDITDYWDFKRKLLRNFESEYARVGAKWEAFCEHTSGLYGLKNGCRYAEGFQCIRWLL